MRVIFAGPSLTPQGMGLTWRGPAKHGDVVRAMAEGATHIGFVDGLYEDVATVWHKELLHALHSGVWIIGGGSLGAIRAAECRRFGMIGVGRIFERYASGELDDDAAVAQLHAPAELGYAALTEALVNVEATLQKLAKLRLIDSVAERRLGSAACRLFFKNRTHETVVEEAGFRGEEAAAVEALLDRHRVDQKRLDARAVAHVLHSLDDGPAPEPDWTLAETQMWRNSRNVAVTMI
jgi:hypothetical protein